MSNQQSKPKPTRDSKDTLHHSEQIQIALVHIWRDLKRFLTVITKAKFKFWITLINKFESLSLFKIKRKKRISRTEALIFASYEEYIQSIETTCKHDLCYTITFFN